MTTASQQPRAMEPAAAAAAAVTAAVDLSTAAADLGRVHLLPCGIKQNGAAAVSDYFKPKDTGQSVPRRKHLSVFLFLVVAVWLRNRCAQVWRWRGLGWRRPSSAGGSCRAPPSRSRMATEVCFLHWFDSFFKIDSYKCASNYESAATIGFFLEKKNRTRFWYCTK